MNNESAKPKPALKLMWGSNANRVAATKEYFWSKNFLPSRYIGIIAKVDTTILSNLVKLE